jgi:hypothetical protein
MLAPLRRKNTGAITPEIQWLLYAENELAPLRRKLTRFIGSIASGRLPALLAPSQPQGILLPQEAARRANGLFWLIVFLVNATFAILAFQLSRTLNRLPFLCSSHGLQRRLLMTAIALLAIAGTMTGFYFGKIAVLAVVTGWLLGVPRARPAQALVPAVQAL